jgi:hypothetical protein
MKNIVMRAVCCMGLLAACATPRLHVGDADSAIALAKSACRDFPDAARLTDWKAALHGAVWEVEGMPDLRHEGPPRLNVGQGASVAVPVDGPKPTRCGGFFFQLVG